MYRLGSPKQSVFCSLTNYAYFEGRLQWHKDITGTNYKTVHLDADSTSSWGGLRFWDESNGGLVISCSPFLWAYRITVLSKISRDNSVYHT